MVFSSLEFIYLFLLPVLGGFLILKHLRLETAIIWWLIVASLTFYALWSPIHLVLLIGSVLANFGLHKVLLLHRSKAILTGGIVANLAVLAWFKYADFLIGNVAEAFGIEATTLNIVLPLAISFFTFQQISFLLDTWNEKISDCDFKRYVLFVVFFPQLIAGPIVLQKDTITQFCMARFENRFDLNIVVGATLFAIGLFKKIVLADGIAPVANAVFAASEAGQLISWEAAWLGAMAYTFQIYFDFSGYCDMALGVARMFGIRLPINFNSPYKALSITDFWRRWHITLSRFLRDYLYIPLGGNRSGPLGRHGNLLITMLLGGLWHGAGWNFIIWGGLHGAFLIINHGWRSTVSTSKSAVQVPQPLRVAASWTLTMGAVIIAWVFFRAETFGGATHLLASMFGITKDVGLMIGNPFVLSNQVDTAWTVAAMILIVTLLPNSIEIMRNYQPVIDTMRELASNVASKLEERIVWRPAGVWGLLIFAVGSTALIQLYRMNDLTEFIYFNF